MVPSTVLFTKDSQIEVAGGISDESDDLVTLRVIDGDDSSTKVVQVTQGSRVREVHDCLNCFA